MKLNIVAPPLKGITLDPVACQILNNCFISLIIGPPGSGKTSLVRQMINDKRFYGEKFDKIITVGKSPFDGNMDEQSHLERPDSQVIQQFITNINDQNIYDDLNILFVFDDCITQMNQKPDFWKKLFLNRRHLIKGGTISHILTTQKFSLVPSFIRACLTEAFVFKCTLYEISALAKWFFDKDELRKLSKLIGQLKEHQFAYLNFLKNKMYNIQFEEIGKKKCKLKIDGRIGFQQLTQPSSLSVSSVGQVTQTNQVSQSTLQTAKNVMQKQEENPVEDKMMQALAKVKRDCEKKQG